MSKVEWLKQPAVNIPGLSNRIKNALTFHGRQDTVEELLPRIEHYHNMGLSSVKVLVAALRKIGINAEDHSEYVSQHSQSSQILNLQKKHSLTKKNASLVYKIARAEGWIAKPLF